MNKDGPPDILIVVDKLLTGFDEPRNTVLYIDKLLKEHNLLQAIARVNRLHEAKKYGYLVDYRGILKELDTSLSDYHDLANETQGGFDIEDLKGTYENVSTEYKRLPALYATVWACFADVENKSDREAFRRVLVPDTQIGADGISFDQNQKVRDDFSDALTEFGMCLKLALSSRSFFEDGSVSEAMVATYKKDLRFFMELRQQARLDAQETVDISQYEKQIRDLVDRQIVAMDIKRAPGLMDITGMAEGGQDGYDAGGGPGSWSPEKTRAETDVIKTRLTKTVEQDLSDDPYAQAVFSELLRKAIAEAESLFDVPNKQYVLFADLEKQLKARATPGVPDRFDGNRHAQAFFGLFTLVCGGQFVQDKGEDWLVAEAKKIDATHKKTKARKTKPRTTSKAHASAATKGGAVGQRGDFDRFFKRYGRTFDVEEFVKTYIKDHVQQEKQVETQCPNRDAADLGDGRISKGHTDKSGTQRKLIASNAGHSDCGISVISCNHNCDGLNTPDYVYLIMKENNLSIDDLEAFLPQSVGDRVDDEVITKESPYDTNKDGFAYKTRRNFRVALAKLGISIKLNSFDGVVYVDGLGRYNGRLRDEALTHLRETMREEEDFYLERGVLSAFVDDEAERNAFHPVQDRLNELRDKWDGKPRIDRLLPDYFGADDTELNRAFGRLTMIAAVRRVMFPGCKYDQILVLQSEQGKGKSTALRILALEDEWFTDSLPINADTKVVMEQTAGKWIVEIAELAGMKKAEMEMVKAFASRQVDQARLAYRKYPTEQPRQFIAIATTNEEKPFKDPTGNRRFWPVDCGQIDLAALKRDRDQLWAEAAVLEHNGESIELPKELYAAASDVQSSRMLEDPFVDKLKLVLGEITGKIAAEHVYEMLDLKPSMNRQYTQENVGRSMAELGWEKKQLRYDGKRVQCFVRGSEQERQREIETHYSDTQRRYVLKDPDIGDPYAKWRPPQEEDEADGTSLH